MRAMPMKAVASGHSPKITSPERIAHRITL
jgi:hypothetical protein